MDGVYICGENIRYYMLIHTRGTSLVVQWLRLHTCNAGGLGSNPGQGTRSVMMQLSVHMLQLEISHATTKTQHSQINK